MNNIGPATPIYFAAVNDKEQNKYKASKEKSKFVSTTASIHLPDLTLSDLIDVFECDGTGIHEDTQKQISPFLENDIPDDVVYVTYLFLHEVGHWVQFTQMHNKVEDFFNEDLKLYQENYNKMQQVLIQRQQRLEKGSNCQLTFRERDTLENLRKEYRNIPKEKDADSFAINNVKLALTTYKSHTL